MRATGNLVSENTIIANPTYNEFDLLILEMNLPTNRYRSSMLVVFSYIIEFDSYLGRVLHPTVEKQSLYVSSKPLMYPHYLVETT